MDNSHFNCANDGNTAAGQDCSGLAEMIAAMTIIAAYFSVCILVSALGIWCIRIARVAVEPSFAASFQYAFGLFMTCAGIILAVNGAPIFVKGIRS